MLYIGEKLPSKEAVLEFNNKVFSFKINSTSASCISRIACEECYHIISDSICMCAGLEKCPNCGNAKQAFNTRQYIPFIDQSFKRESEIPTEIIDNYQI